MTLLFAVGTLVTEIDSFLEMSSGFVENPEPLHELKAQLTGSVGAREGHRFSWEIPRDRPLRTCISEGSYEPAERSGGDTVRAEISSVWDLKLAEAVRGNRNLRMVVLHGKASTRVEVLRLKDGEEEPIAHWRAEIGDAASPGCHFHHQIGDGRDLPFPSAFPVPRLPGLFLTPAAIAEFTLGELFQAEWRERLAKDSYALQQWRRIQKRHLSNVLEWQVGIVNAAVLGSPWRALKDSKPDADLVL